MKSGNQIIVRCKQPIKIEKPLWRLLLFSCCIGERDSLQTVLLSFFCFLFLNAFLSGNNSNTVYVLGHKYILVPSLSRVQNI